MYGALANAWSRRFEDQHLRRQRLVGVPRRALVLAAAALGAGGEVEHPLPGEVLDLADAERWSSSSISSTISMSNGLPSDLSGFTAPRATGLAAEHHVERRHEDVQVLGVHARARRTPASRRCAGAGRRPRAARARRSLDAVQEVAEPRCETNAPLVVRQVAGRRRAPRNRNIVQMTLKIMNSDHPGAAEVRALEAGLAAEPLGRVLEPDQRERDDAEQRHHRDEVLGEAEHRPSGRRSGSRSPGRTGRRTPRGRPWRG